MAQTIAELIESKQARAIQADRGREVSRRQRRGENPTKVEVINY